MGKELLQELFPTFEKELIEELTKYGTVGRFKADEIVLKKGQPMHRMIIVLSGCLQLYQQHDEGEQFLLLYFVQGSAFGVSIYHATPAPTSQSVLRASEDSVIVWLPVSVKDQLVKKFESWYRYLMQMSVAHYRVLLELLDQIAFKKLDERLVHYLRRLSVVQSTTEVRISHQEIARDLNSSREVISRLLKKMESEGDIKLLHNKIQLLQIV